MLFFPLLRQSFVFFLLMMAAASPILAYFVPGEVTLDSGERLSGEIDYLNWNRSPQEITFRQAVGANQTFSPRDLQSFTVQSEVYRSYRLRLDRSPFRTEDLTQNPEIQWEERQVFLALLIAGPLNLLYHRDPEGKPHYFVQQGDALPQELVYHRWLEEKDGSLYQRENKRYIQQLAGLMQNCKDIYPWLNQMRFQAGDLIRLFEVHANACSEVPISYRQPREKGSHQFAVRVGSSITWLDFQSELSQFTGIDGMRLRPSAQVTADVSYIFIVPRTQQRLGFEVGLGYRRQRYETTYARFFAAPGAGSGGRVLEAERLELDFSYLKLHTLAYFRLPRHPWRPYTHLGFSWARMLRDRFELTEVRESGGSVRVVEPASGYYSNLNPVWRINRWEQNLLLGVGAHLPASPFGFEVRYELGPGPSGQPALASPQQVISLMLSYLIDP